MASMLRIHKKLTCVDARKFVRFTLVSINTPVLNPEERRLKNTDEGSQYNVQINFEHMRCRSMEFK